METSFNDILFSYFCDYFFILMDLTKIRSMVVAVEVGDILFERLSAKKVY